MNPDIGSGGTTGQDAIMVPGGITGYLHQTAPHYSRVSSSAFLHCAHILLFLSLLFLHHLLALSGAWGLRVSGAVSGVLSGVLYLAYALWSQSGVILGMCWSSQIRSLPGPHGVSLVAVWCLILVCLAHPGGLM